MLFILQMHTYIINSTKCLSILVCPVLQDVPLRIYNTSKVILQFGILNVSSDTLLQSYNSYNTLSSNFNSLPLRFCTLMILQFCISSNIEIQESHEQISRSFNKNSNTIFRAMHFQLHYRNVFARKLFKNQKNSSHLHVKNRHKNVQAVFLNLPLATL